MQFSYIDIDPDVIDVVKKLQEESFETYIVGGAVRDLMLGINPKDYDVSTAATPEQVKSVFRRKARIIGRRFRLVHYYADHRKIIEISTFRREPPEHEKMIEIKGKLHPNDNCYGSSAEDAWRRDFTVNALFYDPIAEKIFDFTEMGKNDLQNKIIRMIGDPFERFIEDPVRILRALKLTAVYDFHIEENTKTALFRLMPLISNSSRSRLSLEFEKILKNQHAGKILSTFYAYDFLKFFLPELDHKLKAGEDKTKLLFGLFNEWSLRISQGKYRISISISMALLALPFVMDALGLTENNIDFEEHSTKHLPLMDYVSETIRKLTQPHVLPKRLLCVTTNILLLLPHLLKSKVNSKITRHPYFYHACEIFEILSLVLWNNPKLKKKWEIEY